MPALPEKQPDFAAARYNMVESQIRPNKVTDLRILDAFATLPREMFVPRAMAGVAYIDEDIQVAAGRFLLEPMILARLLEEARIQPGHRVLDIGVATGYSTAIIASLCKEVVGVESDDALQRAATENITALKLANAEIQSAPLASGWKAKAPYDVIIINGAVELLPESVTEQLEEGGKLLTVMRKAGPANAAHTGEARLYEKNRGAVSFRPLFDANVKPLAEFVAIRKFTF